MLELSMSVVKGWQVSAQLWELVIPVDGYGDTEEREGKHQKLHKKMC